MMPSAGIASRTIFTRQAGNTGKRMSSHIESRWTTSAPRAQHPVERPGALRYDVFLDLPNRVGDVADHLDLREINGVHFGRLGADVDHLVAALPHEERRLFDDVVADVDDEVGSLERAVHEVAGRERRAAEEFRMSLVDHALAELGRGEWDAGLLDQLQKHAAGHLAVGAGADHQDWRACGLDALDRRADGLLIRGRPPDEAARERP